MCHRMNGKEGALLDRDYLAYYDTCISYIGLIIDNDLIHQVKF